MTARYEPIGHVDAMMNDDYTRDESISPSPSPFHADSASPLSNTTSATMASPSSSAYLTLADQTFTPLSMDASDYYCSDQDDGRNNFGSLESRAIEVGRNHKVLRPTKSTKELREKFEAGIVGATALVTPDGVPIVSAMIQSFEALQPAITGPVGYDIISTINKNKNLGLVSPPSTLSRTPSPSLPSPSSVAHEGPQTFSRANPCTGQDDSKQEKSALQPVSQEHSTPQNTTQDSHSHRDALNTVAVDAKTHTLPALSIPGPPPSSAVTDFAVSSVSAGTTIVRPTAERPSTARSHPASSEPASPTNPLFRSPSTASVALSHPTPDSAKRSRSGAFLGNIAALEATAERLSTASSIDLAIREELDGLKRSDSRRSSILQANCARSVSGSDSASVLGQPQSSVASRHNSILGTNTVARLGGYSPGGFIMSPHSSITGAPLQRLRSNSKASSFNVPSPIAGRVSIDNGGGEENLFMARHGPGKGSVRSVASLGLIAELDLPSGLTKEAFDEADRAAAIGDEAEDDDTIRASAHQQIDPEFADILEDASSPQSEMTVPALDNSLMDLPSPRLQIHQPNDYPQYGETLSVQDYDRPTTSGSNMTFEAQRAFGDFDGVHCDPEFGEFPPPQAQQFQEPALPSPRRLDQPPPRPKSYFDPSTGQQMLYYPAPVPAMLNLPPKLSKKPKGAAVARNIRRSEILSAMPQATPQQPVRESRVWLPDPMQGLNDSRDNEPFMPGLLGDNLRSASFRADPAPQLPDSGTSTIHAPLPSPQHQQVPPELQPQPTQQQREIRRPQKLSGADRRQTRATMLGDLPPQLRASAFFDLPPVLPKVEVKGGSAMDTLDSILDASAHAPVSAFTDHAFAGKLGSEVYGAEKKKKKKKAKAAAADGQDSAENRKTIIPKTSTGDLVDEPRKPNKLRKRASQLSLLGMNPDHNDDADARTTVALVSGEEGARRTSNLGDTSSNHNDDEPFSPNQLAPDSDEETSEEEETSSEEEDVYQGPPTTLLAELQLRKQQNAMRTKPKFTTNGLHTTLLELDTVAEVERKARKGKRINLAWENPGANPDHLDDLDDDEVPLGMLYVAKAAGNTPSTMDISAVMNEVNRPLGLMERRELEDNEPLSQRRSRLQGRDGGLAPMSLAMMQRRMTALTLGPGGPAGGAAGLRSMSRLNLGSNLNLPFQGGNSVMGGSRPGSAAGDAEDAEFEGETLAQRKARLAAENPLPRARPVSGMFSSELLTQFGGEEETKDEAKDKKNTDQVPEEEETLGQRRKRLQAEREAREREMNAGGGGMLGVGSMNPNRNTMLSVAPSASGLEVPVNRLSHRLSTSDLLNAHSFDPTPQGMLDPRTQERLRRDIEAERVARENEAKMAAMRAQMPTNLETVSHGARTGGYMGGRFNDGTGGIPGQHQQQRLPSMAGAGYPLPDQQYPRANTMATYSGMGYPAPVGNVNPVYGAAPYGSAMQLPMQTQAQYPIMGGGIVPGGMQQGQPVDMVERWRQSIMP
ncbi:hypothetical protein QBC37DRAFT_284412 [Rhypophila decipiens]|uniref:Uncharacterized protein n=1 Tax=Rhypophila decipiens TaxID=261697 RepID=A0AAN6YDS8_9PEZI|nr:hypothetical protein QBC37DRAFT_284412 [Rhypophila decipiens]